MKAIADHAAEQQPTTADDVTVLAPTSHDFDADGIRLVVHDWGGAGAPVLLAHPTGFHGRVWEPVATRLVARGRHVWSFDFRGHGDSDAPDIDYSWHGFADDVLAVAEHLGLAGDPDARRVRPLQGRRGVDPRRAEAARARSRGSGRTSRSSSPSEHPLPPQEDFFMARAARKRRNEWRSTDEAFAAYASKPPLDVMTEESLRAYVEYGLRDRGDGVFELKCRPEVEAARVRDGTEPRRVRARWERSTADVLVVCGETSTDIGPPLASNIAERIPHGHARGDGRARPLRPATGPRRVCRVDPALRGRRATATRRLQSTPTSGRRSPRPALGIGCGTARRTSTGRRCRRSGA